MTREVGEILRDALVHLEVLEQYASRDLEDQMVIDAICMRLAAAVEALARLDDATRAGIFGETWPLMWGMRNRIAHGYLLVNPAIIRATIEEDVPHLLQRIRASLD